MFCRNCGKELSDAAVFCPGCGTKVGAAPAQTASTSAPAADKAPAPEAAQAAPASTPAADKAPTPAAPAPLNPVADVPEGKNSKVGVIIFIILILLLLAGAAAGLIYFFTGDNYNIKKNLKLAEQCFEAEEYPDALGYYNAALELDPTLTDVYVKAADIYITDNAYEDAIELLNKGIKKNKEDEEAQKLLKDKLADTYGKAADHYAGKKDFAAAYEMLQNGIDITGDKSLKEKKAEYYVKEAETALENGDFDQAIRVLEMGVNDTGSDMLVKKQVEYFDVQVDVTLEQGTYEDAIALLEEGFRRTGEVTLQSRMSDIYKVWAEDYLPNKDYTRAREILNQGFLQTGDTSLEERKTELYVQESNDLLENGDLLAALAFVEDAAESTGEKALTDRAEYLRDHIRAAVRTTYDDQREVMEVIRCQFDENNYLQSDDSYDAEGILRMHREYDTAGNATAMVLYDEEGNDTDIYKNVYEYDTKGNLTKMVVYDSEGVILSDTEWLFDEQGTQIAEIFYDTDENALYVRTQECVYNDKGELTEYAVYQSKDLDDDSKELIDQGSFHYEYDEQGNISTRVRYYEDGSIRDIEDYDAAGQVIGHREYSEGGSYFVGDVSDGSELRRVMYRYDPLGNLIEEICQDYEEGNFDSFFYEYEYLYMGE